MSQELEIESRPTNDDGKFSSCANALDERKSHCSITASSKGVRRVCNAIEVVRYQKSILFAR